jgi:hypothetical protein
LAKVGRPVENENNKNKKLPYALSRNFQSRQLELRERRYENPLHNVFPTKGVLYQ